MTFVMNSYLKRNCLEVPGFANVKRQVFLTCPWPSDLPPPHPPNTLKPSTLKTCCSRLLSSAQSSTSRRRLSRHEKKKWIHLCTDIARSKKIQPYPLYFLNYIKDKVLLCKVYQQFRNGRVLLPSSCFSSAELQKHSQQAEVVCEMEMRSYRSSHSCINTLSGYNFPAILLKLF